LACLLTSIAGFMATPRRQCRCHARCRRDARPTPSPNY
jgi:hypothetical protein